MGRGMGYLFAAYGCVAGGEARRVECDVYEDWWCGEGGAVEMCYSGCKDGALRGAEGGSYGGFCSAASWSDLRAGCGMMGGMGRTESREEAGCNAEDVDACPCICHGSRLLGWTLYHVSAQHPRYRAQGRSGP